MVTPRRMWYGNTWPTFQEAARATRWKSSEHPGRWVKVTRTFRDGSSQDWWTLEVVTGPYGPTKQDTPLITLSRLGQLLAPPNSLHLHHQQ